VESQTTRSTVEGLKVFMRSSTTFSSWTAIGKDPGVEFPAGQLKIPKLPLLLVCSLPIYGPSSLCTRIAADAEFSAEVQVSTACSTSVENRQLSAGTSQANLGNASVCETTVDVRMKTAVKIGFSLRACIIWCIMATGCLSAQFC
jgi:hypothetical protein